MSGDALFELQDPTTSGLDFTNTVTNTDELNIFNYRNFYNGGGVGMIDVNNDGLTDVFLTANMGPNKLFLNKGNLRFEDISATSGIELPDKWSTGVAVVDINADGWLDIYVANAGFLVGTDQKNSLFINNQDNTFREAAEQFNLADPGYTTHAAFFDYDLDGDLDVYLLNNSFIPVNNLNFSNDRERYAEEWRVKPFLRGGGDKLMRNDGRTYTDVTKEAGIYGSLIGFGLGITVGDVNNDRYPDLYISNDFYERDYLYINRGDGTFSEEIEDRTGHISLASMGADMADLNGDGNPEIFVTEMLPETDYRRKTTVQFEDVNLFELKQRRGFFNQYMHNTLQLNNGRGDFTEIAQYSGVEATDWSWGALLFDADLDGKRDIYVCNGIYHSLTDQDFIDFFSDEVTRKMAISGKKQDIDQIIKRMPSDSLPNKMFRNTGDLTFEDVTDRWGLDIPTFSNGAAYGDLDNDGDLDLVVNNVNQPALLYRNLAVEGGKQSFKVQLAGVGENTKAIGAKVYVTDRGGAVMAAELIPTRGFQSSVDYTLVFGVAHDEVEQIDVVWPDGTASTTVAPDSGQTLLIDRAQISTTPLAESPFAPAAGATLDASTPKNNGQKNVLLREVPDLPFLKHQEDEYSDLLTDGLVMRSLAYEGPAVAVGDLNGDDLDDIVIGGARNQAAQVYLQTADGAFALSDQPVMRQLAQTEDTAAALFDADGDGDLDLYLGSGGNFDRVNALFLSDKIVFNDGEGNFSTQPGSLPRFGLNTSVVVPFDYDDDGDQDLFVGTRSMPLNYGVPAPSTLLENDGTGGFSNRTGEIAAIFSKLGMVTDAVTWKIDDGRTGLLTTSEWGAPQLVVYNGDEFELVTTNLSDLNGWWYTAEPVDVDGDGDLDIILGNRGENFYFTATAESPAKLWVSDFDRNGTDDKVVTQHVDGKDMPLAMKRDLSGQVNSLKKESLRHAEYAEKSIQEMFTREVLDQATVYTTDYFKSVVAINDGANKFSVRPLPITMQLSSVHAAAVISSDPERPILLLGGNDSQFRPQFSRLDGSRGTILHFDPDTQDFYVPDEVDYGLDISGDIKHIESLTVGGRRHVLVLINNETPRLYEIMSSEEDESR